MSSPNKHGLSRDIPAEVQRAVRQRCGFGCAVCGCAIYQYEHVDPPFADATSHDPNTIALLCGGCHDRVTRGLLSKDSVKSALRNPKALQSGFSFGPFDVGSERPDVYVGAFHAINVPVVIRAMGQPLLSVAEPEQAGGPFRLSAYLADRTGKEILSVQDNEWRTAIGNWDAEVVGRRITLRRGPGDITLRLRTDPPHTLTIERLDMFHQGAHILCDEQRGLIVASPFGPALQAHAATARDSQIGIDVGPGGIVVGVGGGSVTMGSARVFS